MTRWLKVSWLEYLCLVLVLTFSVLTHFLLIRRFHKEHTSLPAVNLPDQQMQTQTQKFIATYYKLEEDGIPKENLCAAALDVVNVAGTYKSSSGSAASYFQEAQRDTSVKIMDIFKD
jgi:hypothetical protein